MSGDSIYINVPVLARVEGEGALDLRIENRQISDVKLRLYEPPRYFEKFLQGRNYYDVPDTVARICGICPVAYQMSACHAIESIFGITVNPWIRAMRRLFYCGEWLQSHSLHIHLLAAPDFLGCNSVIEMSEHYGNEVRRGLKLQALGNELIAMFGARSVHPVGVRIGGFSRVPDKNQVVEILSRVTQAKQDAIELIHWLDRFELPQDNQDFVSVALHHDDEYPFNEGRLLSDNGLDIAIADFEQHFTEKQVAYSTALHCLLHGQPYLVGPLARINLNSEQLPEAVKAVMQTLQTVFPSKNMFHSMIARAIEIYYVLIEAEQLLSRFEVVDQPCMEVEVRAGTGYGCTEAPRGFLWHRYDMDARGCVSKAIIVPPTSQNQARIEQDIKTSLSRFGLDKEKHILQLHAEKVIRNYDPCISCATHFLTLNILRDGLAEKQVRKTSISALRNVDLSTTAIIGIGSPHSGDELGWQMIDQLLQYQSVLSLQRKGLSLFKLDRHGLSLIEQIKPYYSVIIIDALKSDEADHSFICIDGSRLSAAGRQISSHQAGVIDAISLLQSLPEKPPQLWLIGVSVIRAAYIERIINMLPTV